MARREITTPQERAQFLQLVDAQIARGYTQTQACQSLNIKTGTYYYWRKEAQEGRNKFYKFPPSATRKRGRPAQKLAEASTEEVQQEQPAEASTEEVQQEQPAEASTEEVQQEQPAEAFVNARAANAARRAAVSGSSSSSAEAAQVSALNAKIEALEGALVQTKADLKAAKDELRARPEDAEELRKQLGEALETNTSLARELQRVNNRRDALRVMLQAAQKEVAAYKKSVGNVDMENLRLLVKEAEEARDHLQKTVDTLSQKLATASFERDAAAEVSRGLSAQLREKDAELARTQRELEILQQRNRTLEARMRKVHASATRRSSAREGKTTAQAVEIESLHAKLQAAHARFADLDTIVDAAYKAGHVELEDSYSQIVSRIVAALTK